MYTDVDNTPYPGSDNYTLSAALHPATICKIVLSHSLHGYTCKTGVVKHYSYSYKNENIFGTHYLISHIM